MKIWPAGLLLCACFSAPRYVGPTSDHFDGEKFFTPGAHKVSEPFTVLKYDIEVSSFGSHLLGHVCLLNLRDPDYPGSAGGIKKGWKVQEVGTLPVRNKEQVQTLLKQHEEKITELADKKSKEIMEH